MTLRPRDKAMLGVVAGLIAIVAFYMLVLTPLRHRAAGLDSQIADQHQQLTTAQTRFTQGRAAQQSLRTHAADWAALQRAVPDNSDIPALLRVLERNAASAGVDMQSIALSGSGGSSGSTAPTPTATSTDGATSVPLTLTFKGGYVKLDKLVRRLDGLVVSSGQHVHASGPLLSISNVSLSGSPLTVQLTANIYQLSAPGGSSETGTSTAPGGSTS